MCGIKKKTFKEPKYHEGSFLGLFYFCILKRSSRTVLSSALFTRLQRTPSYKFGSVRSSTQYLGTFTFEYVHCKCNGEVQYYMNEPQGFNYCKGQSLCIEINRLNTKQFKSYMLELEFEFELDFELDFDLYFELQKQQKKIIAYILA